MISFDKAKTFFKKKFHSFLGDDTTNSIFKNMGILASGSGVAKVLGIAAYPVITRIYSPDDFGVLAVFTSAIAILVPFYTLRYSVAIPLPKNNGLALNLMALGLGLIVIFSTLLSFLFITFGDAIFSFFNMAEIANYWWLLVLGLVGAGLFELLTSWATRVKQFSPVAKATIWQSFSSVTTIIGLGLLGIKPLGLLIGDVVKRGGGILTLARHFLRDVKDNFQHLAKKRIIFIATYYKDLPLYRLPSQFLLVFSTKMPVLYFAFQFGSEPTGQLGLALMVVAIPMSLIGSNTGKAYYAEIAKIGANKRDEVLELTKSITKRLSLLSLFPTLILLLFSPFLFQVIFGQEWLDAGIFTSILAFYLFTQFITSPLVNVFNVYNQQSKFLEINLVRIVLIGIVFISSFHLELNVYETLISYTVIISGHYLFTGYQIYRVIK